MTVDDAINELYRGNRLGTTLEVSGNQTQIFEIIHDADYQGKVSPLVAVQYGIEDRARTAPTWTIKYIILPSDRPEKTMTFGAKESSSEMLYVEPHVYLLRFQESDREGTYIVDLVLTPDGSAGGDRILDMSALKTEVDYLTQLLQDIATVRPLEIYQFWDPSEQMMKGLI